MRHSFARTRIASIVLALAGGGCASAPDLTKDAGFRVGSLDGATPAVGELKRSSTSVTNARRARGRRFRLVSVDENDELEEIDESDGIEVIAAGNSPTPKLGSVQRVEHPVRSGRNRRGDGRSPASNGSDVAYTVRAGDTLMKIAYAHYGDIFRWRDIVARNPNVKGVGTLLAPGTRILLSKVSPPSRPSGDPYSIVRGDSLLKISSKVYGTRELWWSLWDNNRRLVTDPDRIYAGFTLYALKKGRIGKRDRPTLATRSASKTPKKRVTDGFPTYEAPRRAAENGDGESETETSASPAVVGAVQPVGDVKARTERDDASAAPDAAPSPPERAPAATAESGGEAESAALYAEPPTAPVNGAPEPH